MKITPILLCALLSGCATTSDRQMLVDIRVSNLTEQDQIRLEKELADLPGVKNVRTDPFGERTVFTFEYVGSYDRLKHRISFIKSPGLRPEKEVNQLYFEGFDNTPPSLTIISPKPEQIQTKTRVTFIVEVVDNDIKSVVISKSNMKKTKGNLYEKTLDLFEGENSFPIVVTDDAGNVAEQTVVVNVDTKAPQMESTVKVVVEGKVESGSTVFVDGQQASVNMFGKWRIELNVKRGQKTVEVVAIDKAGNKKTELKSIGL